MHIGLAQTVRMDQRLIQSPQMIQAMQILQLSSGDLQEKIEEELLGNPLLERVEAQEAAPAEAAEAQASTPTRPTRDEEWDSPLRSHRVSQGESDRKHEAMQNSPARYHSLGQSLLSQIALVELDVRLRAMIEFLVFSLDARGYLPCSLAELSEECPVEGATEAEFAYLLEELRHATHPSLGARDLRECLLLQVSEAGEGHGLLRTLIAKNLSDVAANRLPRIARATGYSIGAVGEAVDLLRTLDPCPGSAYGEAPADVIRPDVAVEEIDGTFRVRLTRDGTPELRISADYTALMRGVARGDPVRTWIGTRLGAARWFLHALEQRQTTLLRVVEAIFERQRGFLEKGAHALVPLRMGEIGVAANVHLSTVSRAVAGKYAQTPHGILPLRSFFSSGTTRASGGAVCKESVQTRVKELVEEEDPSAPRSDDRLAELLLERDGIRLARRTITKYRRIMAISSSLRRRAY